MSQSEPPDTEERIARLEQQDERLTRALELLASHHAAPPRKDRRDWDRYAAVIASLIGILALATSGYTAYVQRQQLRAQVWPRLELAYSGTEPKVFVLNEGMGPARVTAVRVTVDGTPVKDWGDAQKVAGFTPDEPLLRSGLAARVLPPGKDFVIIKPSDSDQSRAKFRELLPRGKHAISMIVCYCSVLDDCWVTTLGVKGRSDDPVDPEACPIGDADRFHE